MANGSPFRAVLTPKLACLAAYVGRSAVGPHLPHLSTYCHIRSLQAPLCISLYVPTIITSIGCFWTASKLGRTGNSIGGEGQRGLVGADLAKRKFSLYALVRLEQR